MDSHSISCSINCMVLGGSFAKSLSLAIIGCGMSWGEGTDCKGDKAFLWFFLPFFLRSFLYFLGCQGSLVLSSTHFILYLVLT